MTKKLKIVLAQLNFTVGDLAGNTQKHIDAAKQARDEHKADIIVFPELSITGYPPEDLLLRPGFISEALSALEQLAQTVTGIHMLVGHPYPAKNGLTNACSLIFNNKLLGHYAKQHLPNYTVFDERRYFIPKTESCVVDINGVRVGILICEDTWHIDAVARTIENGAEVILSINASPFVSDKHERRIGTLAMQANATHTPMVYVNQVGGQDELVFDGGSMVLDNNGQITHFAGFFNETLLPIEFIPNKKSKNVFAHMIDKSLKFMGVSNHIKIPGKTERIYNALVLAVRDYINKNNIQGVLIGLSGGIDSALTLAIATEALGSDRVHAVSMPSPYTAEISKTDAATLANKLNVTLDEISIEATYQSFLDTLTPDHLNTIMDVTHENIQARCRAIILMALSNKTGYLVLTTGNRSEIAVGYCTLYGDMAGGFAPLKDIPKTMVYELANYCNRNGEVIPQRTIDRPPSAELAPDQLDQDTLPPYPILDEILDAYMNQSMTAESIINKGYQAEIVNKIVAMIKRNEYKRKQSATGPRVNHKSFGKDWRYPITNAFKG